MKEALSSSETSVLTRVTLRDISEDIILHSHGHENLKYYKNVTDRILHIIYGPDFYLKTGPFGDQILSPSSGGISGIRE
jgi:hypothetical protein